jgi:hypothetical protein
MSDRQRPPEKDRKPTDKILQELAAAAAATRERLKALEEKACRRKPPK